MPLELGVWRIDGGVQAVEFGPLNLESRLEDILAENIGIASPNWMIIGRQVPTTFGGFVDLLAIDQDGDLIVLELKRDKTHRDIVAQSLDYGSWVKRLRDEEITQIFQAYQRKHESGRPAESLDNAFCRRFGVKEMPEELNSSHELVIVASTLDPATERIVTYLAEQYQVKINAIFFRVFRDGGHEYLSRVWLNDPTMIEAVGDDGGGPSAEWNGEYYVSFGAEPDRDWEEARKYGFVSAGGGSWYTRTLAMLEPGARIWVNVPAVGYVGVGEVLEAPVPIDEFLVEDGHGQRVPITSLSLNAAKLGRAADDPERAEHMVRVKWLKTVPLSEAVRERGFFGNQNTVAQPKASKWNHTIERLRSRWNVK